MFSPKTQHTTKPTSSKSNGGGSFIQPKLNVGKPGDKYEVEADKAADQIVAKGKETSNSFFAPTVQKKNEEEIQKQESNEQEIQQKPLVDSISPVVQLKSENSLQKQEEDLQQKEEEDVQKSTEEEVQTKKETTESPFAGEVIQQQAEEDIQEKEEEEIQEKEEKEIQQLQMSGGDDNSSLESNLSSSKGGGNSLPSGTKNEMESGFGANFSGVRVHNDSNAVQMNKELGSQAFTNGNDIYFNEGKYNPTSESGKHLLAHELTHTIQQGASTGVQTKLIQKTGDDTEYDRDNFSFELEGRGNFDVQILSSGRIIVSKLPVQPAKVGFLSGSFTRPKNYNRNSQPNNQRELWSEGLKNTGGITSFIANKNLLGEGIKVLKTPDGNGGRLRRIIGDINTLKSELTFPSWRENGRGRWFQVDHKKELQLGGDNDIDNMWLLNEDSNRSSGFHIYRIIRSISAKIGEHERDARNTETRDNLRNADIIMQNWDIEFSQAIRDPNSRASENPSNWTKSKIESGDHLKDEYDIQQEFLGDLGSANEVMVFPFQAGGVGKRFRNNENILSREKTWLDPWEITAKQFNTADGSSQTENLGSFTLALKDNTVASSSGSHVVTIKRYSGAQFAGYLEIDKTTLRTELQEAFDITGMSPVQFHQVHFDNEKGITITGVVNPTLGLIEDTTLDLEISSGDIKVSKIFSTGSFNFPSPFEIKDSSLELFLSIERGLGIEGRVDFGIDNVGEGHIGAAASTAGGFELEGAFNFDSELFDPAEINVEYKENIWTIGGEIGIPEGKVRGIKNATITATYSENNFTATGTAELDIPGIERGTMTVNYGDEGFSISGNFDLSSDIPGIRGGNVEARVAKETGAENYDIFVSGTAQPDIPGIDTQLTVTYDNGALTIEGSAAYNRGMLSGTVNIGATNRAIGEDGEPSGEPDENMRVYGGGSLTLTLTPWLQATAGVNFLPNGEIEIAGRIGLPDTVDIFDRQSVDRNLFNMPAIEIPIFAIPLGPRSIGVVARITGGLDFSAGFGPGQIRSLYADVIYNPDREDETTISGHGEFVIPADAGLTLRGDLGLGVSVGFASLTGGIEVAGSLGLEGEALAQVDVNWSPQSGLAIDALGRVTVNPKFTFDINAFARASLDLWLLSISETWRHNLASFSWGPDIQFGIEFPVNYREGEPFNMSFEDLRVIYPELDIGDMLTDLGRDIKDDIF
ncbi:eCIS core domain-containing protein [Tenacibaculum sp. Ill]|uniref:eCIS core domain-containing protein n=1 Tax=Tenacibaculum sp. Ill TaxID=3445935 RepID=UPI003F792BA4